MSKARINVSLDQDLAEFVRGFAAENRVSVADVFTQYLLALRKRVQGGEDVGVLSHPAFQQAMEDVQVRLRSGSAQWHSFEEVFGD